MQYIGNLNLKMLERYENNIILLKYIYEINKKARIVIKIASSNDKKHSRNSIITLMQLNDRTWKKQLKIKEKLFLIV